jgi:hypothetical protein
LKPSSAAAALTLPHRSNTGKNWSFCSGVYFLRLAVSFVKNDTVVATPKNFWVLQRPLEPKNPPIGHSFAWPIVTETDAVIGK